MIKQLLFLLVFPLLVLAQPDSDGIYFDGIDDKITMSVDSRNINDTNINNRTYEMYFRIKNNMTSQIILQEGAGVRGLIVFVTNGYLYCGAFNNLDYYPYWEGTFYRTLINANQWYHMALVFDNAKPASLFSNPMIDTANKALKFYLDGALKAEISGYEVVSDFFKRNRLSIGYKRFDARIPDCGSGWYPPYWQPASADTEYCFDSSYVNYSSGFYFNGNIWGFRIWDDVRTQAEINDNKETIIMSIGTDNLVAALDGDTFTYLDSNDNYVNDDITNQITRRWNASAASANWNDASNWVGGAMPESNSLQSVIIPSGASNYPEITSRVKVGDVSLESGAKVHIKENGVFDVHYDLDSSGDIKVDNNGSLLIREGETDKTAYTKGTVVFDRDTPDYPADYYSIWSSPMQESSSVMGNIFTNPVIALEWDATVNPGKYNFVKTTDKLKTAKGYFVRSDNYNGKLTRVFSGEINNGDIDVPIYNLGVGGRNNLIGNPYSSVLYWNKVYAENKDVVEGTIYFWKDTGFDGLDKKASDYVPYNLSGSNIPGVTGYIGSGQGFYVKSLKSGTLTLKNCQRTANANSQFYRTTATANKNKLWLKLEGNNLYSSVLIAYLNGATNEYSSAYDGMYRGSKASVKLYTLLDDKKLSIEGKAPLQSGKSDSIPLGFEAKVAGNYSISRVQDFLDKEYDIILEDKLNNVLTNLRIKDYNFSLSTAVVDNSRFLLHIGYNSKTATNDDEYDTFNFEASKITAYFNANTLNTVSNLANTAISGIKLYDATGKLIVNTKYANTLSVQVSSGVYLVKYTLANGGVVSKKLVKNK